MKARAPAQLLPDRGAVSGQVLTVHGPDLRNLQAGGYEENPPAHRQPAGKPPATCALREPAPRWPRRVFLPVEPDPALAQARAGDRSRGALASKPSRHGLLQSKTQPPRHPRSPRNSARFLCAIVSANKRAARRQHAGDRFGQCLAMRSAAGF